MEHMNFINDMVARGLQHLYLTNERIMYELQKEECYTRQS